MRLAALCRFWRWEHRDVVLVFVVLAIEVYMMTGCSPRPETREPVATVTPWCLSVTLKWGNGSEHGLFCGSSRDVCESTRSRAIRYGALAKILEVGQCRRETP